jgi:hypothetical protein
MRPEQVLQDVKASDSVERPSFVLVCNGAVVAHFGPDEAQAAADTAYRLTEREGKHVDLFEVDRRLPAPPAIGTLVDPQTLGWVDVN